MAIAEVAEGDSFFIPACGGNTPGRVRAFLTWEEVAGSMGRNYGNGEQESVGYG